MSTSDQPGSQPLTRKQLREMRLTGATPVISDEEAAAAAAAPAPLPKAAKPVEVAPAPTASDADITEVPLTRRQARVHERIRTASVSVVDAPEGESESAQGSAAVAGPEDAKKAAADDDIVSGVPAFDASPKSAVVDASESEPASEEQPAPKPAVVDEVPAPVADAAPADADDDEGADEAVAAPVSAKPSDESAPVVSPAFGKDVLDEPADVPAFTPSFDELITSDSGGSQHNAPNTLIFTPSPGEGSLSGPVASTGELLVTGSYELPHGLGSQGHAAGTTDGREADAVLIDGELPPASSPTPIAASAAVSTIKPAGEVIRPPAPEKGNKLMLTLAITAGGLAIALAAALVLAFTMNVF